MALSFAGVKLDVPAAPVIEWVRTNISLSDLYLDTRQHWAEAIYDLPEDLPAVMSGRPIDLGQLYWPSGASCWASAFFTVGKDEAATLSSYVGLTGTLIMSEEYQTANADGSLAYTAGGAQILATLDSISATMTLLPMRKLSAVTGSDDLWLITLVDTRFFWWGHNTGSLTVVEGTTTWSDLINNLLMDLGYSSSSYPTNSNYGKPSDLAGVKYEPTPPWLDSILFACGLRLTAALDGSVVVTGTPGAAPDTTVGTIAGGEGTNPSGGYTAPQTVDVVFPVKLHGQYNGQVSMYTGTGTGSSGTFVYRAPVTDIVSNSVALQNYTTQFATDLCSFLGAQLYDINYGGIVSIVPNVSYGNIIWTYQRDELSTRVQPTYYMWRPFPLPRSVGSSQQNRPGQDGCDGRDGRPGPPGRPGPQGKPGITFPPPSCCDCEFQYPPTPPSFPSTITKNVTFSGIVTYTNTIILPTVSTNTNNSIWVDTVNNTLQLYSNGNTYSVLTNTSSCHTLLTYTGNTTNTITEVFNMADPRGFIGSILIGKGTPLNATPAVAYTLEATDTYGTVKNSTLLGTSSAVSYGFTTDSAGTWGSVQSGVAGMPIVNLKVCVRTDTGGLTPGPYIIKVSKVN